MLPPEDPTLGPALTTRELVGGFVPIVGLLFVGIRQSQQKGDLWDEPIR